MPIRWNQNALRRLGNDAGRSYTEKAQQALDRAHRTHSGRPKAEVRAHLDGIEELASLTPREAILDSAAATIAAGERFEPRFEPK